MGQRNGIRSELSHCATQNHCLIGHNSTDRKHAKWGRLCESTFLLNQLVVWAVCVLENIFSPPEIHSGELSGFLVELVWGPERSFLACGRIVGWTPVALLVLNQSQSGAFLLQLHIIIAPSWWNSVCIFVLWSFRLRLVRPLIDVWFSRDQIRINTAQPYNGRKALISHSIVQATKEVTQRWRLFPFYANGCFGCAVIVSLIGWRQRKRPMCCCVSDKNVI